MFNDNYFQIVYSYIVLQHIPRTIVRNYFVEKYSALFRAGSRGAVQIK